MKRLRNEACAPEGGKRVEAASSEITLARDKMLTEGDRVPRKRRGRKRANMGPEEGIRKRWNGQISPSAIYTRMGRDKGWDWEEGGFRRHQESISFRCRAQSAWPRLETGSPLS